ncbi:fasciclin domain-containing protein [Bacteroidota bacterium]
MNFVKEFIIWYRQRITVRGRNIVCFLMSWIVLSVVCRSCETDRPHESPWFTYTISEYIEANQDEFSNFYRLLNEGKLENMLYGYNPYGEGYTLFLPSDEAVEHFILQSPYIGSIGELLLDTNFVKSFTRYHTVNEKIHSDAFPYGALTDRTLTGDRLAFNFYEDGGRQIIKVNNIAPIIEANLEMANGYIHVISEVLQPLEISGFDWLQEQEDYSILAQVVELTEIEENWLNEYTILAEHDSVYHRYGIHTIEDLINRIATPEIPYTDEDNAIYQFAAYHILFNEYFLNDLELGTEAYWTLADEPVTITVASEIRINPGLDTLAITISEAGDTTVIDYVRFIWEGCNIMTQTGPVHSITDLLVIEPFPEEDLIID